MIQLETVRDLLRYNDWANTELLRTAASLSDAALDRTFEMGVGSLRRTLIHVYNGEHVWLNRWQGRAETPWPGESEPIGVAALRDRFAAHVSARDAYLTTLRDSDLHTIVAYRDSRGSRFRAARGDMLFQAINHSIHHRAQAVNMVRNVGGGLVELDYMMWKREATGE